MYNALLNSPEVDPLRPGLPCLRQRVLDAAAAARRTLLALLLVFAAPLALRAEVPSAQALARVVDARYNHLSTFKARFTERYRGMGMDRTESGTLTLRKPGRMRWDYDAPAGKVFVLNGKDAVSYVPGDAQANRLPAKQLDDLRSPLRFLLGHTQLSRELDHLSLAPVEQGQYSLTGVPHGMAERVRQVTLVVDSAGQIHSLQIDEVDGAITTFQFSAMQENTPAPDSEFIFTPPPGVTVVDSPAPM